MNVNAKFMSIMFVLIMVSSVIFYFNFRMYHDKKKLWTCGLLVIGYAVWLKERGSFKGLKVNHNDKRFAILMLHQTRIIVIILSDEYFFYRTIRI